MQNDNEETNFGFQKVAQTIKKSLVNNVFSEVSNKYDLMNDIMSFGTHRIWKDIFCSKIENLNSNILDVASGSGDIAIRLIEKAKRKGADLNLILSDINIDMLKTARNKAINQNLLNLNYICADAENLPFQNESFDYYTIVFGIRNVANIKQALKEASRVLKPGGKFLCMEFSKVDNKILREFYEFYSLNIIPFIGKIVSQSEGSYRYLAESIKMFPDQNSLKSIIENSGFKNVTYENLNFGIVSIHIGYKS